MSTLFRPDYPIQRAGGGIELALEDALVTYVSEWTKVDQLRVKSGPGVTSNYNLTEDDSYGAPTVHAGILPKQQTGAVDVGLIPVFPFILCHITHGKDELPEGVIYTRLVFGTWDDNPDYQGYRDCLYLMRKVIRKFWYVNTVLESFQMHFETDYRIYDSNEVSWPYFLGECTLGWRMNPPVTRYDSELEFDV